ncbi:MAG: serine acetyltransferase [Lentisphaerae bacterium]|nr:serine acetyltransferase [Lentisphaerota bacterium]
MTRLEKKNAIEGIHQDLMVSYADGFGVNDAGGDSLPRRSEVISITEKLLELIFPGFDRAGTYPSALVLLGDCVRELSDQISRAMRRVSGDDCNCCENGCSSRCDELALAFMKQLPGIRETMKLDVKAAYNGDPAARNFDEIILSYPGVKAVAIQRLAHVLYDLEVPLIPRMMTEYAHSVTGIDIHPGAKIGAGVFIDHGTGVVVGETAVIGDNVRIYQGVTLGAGNFPKNACGMLIKGLKRHPTVGCNVTIYSGASVLGDITIGDNSVIGGNVWLTESLPPGTKITSLPPENKKKFMDISNGNNNK